MTASDDDLIQKGQDDLIRRGDALNLMQLAIDVYGQNMRDAADKKEKRDWQSMLFSAVNIRYAIKDIPAVQVTAYSENDVAALVEALEWYISEDETNEGDEPMPDHGNRSWNEINSYWIEGKRKAEAALARVKGGA